MRVPRPIRRVAAFCLGGVVALAGVIMLFTPGPGVPAILVGLAILATEFAWAQRLLARMRAQAGETGGQLRAWWRRRKDTRRE